MRPLARLFFLRCKSDQCQQINSLNQNRFDSGRLS